MSGRERRKGEAVAAVSDKSQSALPAPDVKRFQQSLAELTAQVKEKESQRQKGLAAGGQSLIQLNGELGRVTSELAEIGQLKTTTTVEVREVEEQVRKLGPEITGKKEEASKVLVGLRCKTTDRIEDALRKLRQQLLTRQFSGTEERKLQVEIDTLENSKDELREYQRAKAEIEEMIQEQGKLRERRNSMYARSRELRTREGEAKDRQAQLRKKLNELRDRKKDLQEQKDALTEEIDALYKARLKLRDDFKKAQSMYLTATSELETEERERESMRRGAERRERRKRLAQEAEMRREMKYDEEKSTCRTLIAHLEKLAEPSSAAISSTTTTTSNGGLGLDPQRSHSSPAAPVSLPTPPLSGDAVREGGQLKQPGEFLPRKTEALGAYLVPSSKRRSRRDKKKHTPHGKAQRRLQYDPMVLSQFAFLSLAPPTTHSTIPQVLQTLREKLAYYEHKTSVYSEAGDSGIGSQALGDLTADLNSQDDFDHTSPNRHPLKPLPLTPDLSPPLSNGGPTANSPPSSSLILHSLSTSHEEKVFLHSISTSTTASNNSTTTLVQPSVE